MIIRHGVPGDAGVGNIAKELCLRRPVLILHARQVVGRVALLRQCHPGIAEMILFEEIILKRVSRCASCKFLKRPACPSFFMGHELQRVYAAVGIGNGIILLVNESVNV